MVICGEISGVFRKNGVVSGWVLGRFACCGFDCRIIVCAELVSAYAQLLRTFEAII